MELQKLKYFHTVAALGHVTRAAESICIAQPALTQAIRSLERELGVPLFEKRGRNVVLTEYGRHLKERLDRILPELDALPEELARMKGEATRTVKLNILAASSFVVSCIVDYRKEHPDALFDFEQNEQRFDADLVITTNGSDGRSAGEPTERCVLKEQIRLAVPKTSVYAKKSSIALSEVREEGFVLLSGTRLFGAICTRFCSEAGFSPRILFGSDSPTAVQNIIGTGTGVAFWPAYSWGGINDESVRLLPISSPDCARDLILERYERAPRSIYAEEFYRFLIDRLSSADARASKA